MLTVHAETERRNGRIHRSNRCWILQKEIQRVSDCRQLLRERVWEMIANPRSHILVGRATTAMLGKSVIIGFHKRTKLLAVRFRNIWRRFIHHCAATEPSIFDRTEVDSNFGGDPSIGEKGEERRVGCVKRGERARLLIVTVDRKP